MEDPKKDIKSIVELINQAAPTFRADRNYCPFTSGEVRQRLITEKNHNEQPPQKKEQFAIKSINWDSIP
jgi:hypothetical protein